eukprot:SAG11_NODE_2691_length_3090_cov_6.560682_2_plen_317_part_00
MAIASSLLRRLDEGVWPDRPEAGNPSNRHEGDAPNPTTRFLLGERIAAAEAMMEESPYGRFNDELRMTLARINVELDGISKKFNFLLLTVSCAEDVASTKKRYEDALDKERRASSHDGSQIARGKLKDARRRAQARFNLAKAKHLFSRTTIGMEEPAVLELRLEHYRVDPDFGDLYRYLTFHPSKGIKQPTCAVAEDESTLSPPLTQVEDDSTQKPSKRSKKGNLGLSQDQDPSGSPISDIKKLRSKFNIRQFFIDPTSKLLYFVSTQGHETLCIPDYKIGGESMRYTIFMELHDSPFFGHRGVTGTIGAIRQRFY